MEPLSGTYKEIAKDLWGKFKKGAQDTAINAQIAKLQLEIAAMKHSNPEKYKTQIENVERQIKILEEKKVHIDAMIDIMDQLHHRILSLELKMQGAHHTY